MCSCAVLDIINEKIIIQNKKKIKNDFQVTKKICSSFQVD